MIQHYTMTDGLPSVRIKCYIMADKIVDKYNSFIKKNKQELVKKGWNLSSKADSFQNKELRMNIVTSLFKNSVDVTFNFDTVDKANEHIDKEVQWIVKRILNLDAKARLNIDVTVGDKRGLRLSPGLYEQLLCEAGYRNTKFLEKRYRKFEIIDGLNITTNVFVTGTPRDSEVDYVVDLENSIIDTSQIQDAMDNAMYYYYLKYVRIHYDLLSQIQPSFIKVNQNFYDSIEAFI